MNLPRSFHLGAILLLLAAPLRSAGAELVWRVRESGVTVATDSATQWRIVSTIAGEFTVDGAESLPARPGDCFAISIRVRVGLDMTASPELVCYGADGREIGNDRFPPRGNPAPPSYWQSFSQVYPALPGTTSVRARLRCRGAGTIQLADFGFHPTEVDTYRTGVLVSQLHQRRRMGILLESNFGIVNRGLVSRADRDNDGRWSLVTIDLDQLTAPEKRGEDWRSNFEDNPNVILWSDGAVLKSDTVHADRAPDIARALHYRTTVHPGPYVVRVSDPGRPVALSLDGKSWRRCEPGAEIELGTLPVTDGMIEFWMDACYLDPIKAGPAYFDYVRLSPPVHAPAIDRLFAAARKKTPQLTRGSADEIRVPVTVAAPSFAAAATWPVRCGLPIPRGELVGAECVAVLNPAGARTPSTCRVTAIWPDGSAKWIFIDFVHELSLGAPAAYTVVYGNRVSSLPPRTSVELKRTAAGVEVNTGAIRFLVSGTRFGMVEDVRLASGQTVQREPIGAEIVEAGGTVWRAQDLPVTRLEIEREGPLHAVIVAETRLAESGKPASGFYHRARIHAYAGSPLVEVDYFVANTDSRPAQNVGGSMASKVVIRSFALRLQPDAPIIRARHDVGVTGATGARVQKTDETALTLEGTESREARETVRGWAALSLGNGGSLHVGVADFREQYPKALRWSPQGVDIALWAEEGGAFDWIEGVGKTHHIALVYGAGAAVDASLLATGPVLATARHDWYVRSGALGPIVTAAESGLPELEQSLAAHMDGPVIARVGLGFENYGDHSSGGYVKGSPLWDNNEYDTPAACLVHFARTGSRAALRLGLAGAQHYVDVDMIHYSSQHADWVRAQHVHSHGTFGHHTAQRPDFHHAGYVQGLLWHTYLTGDPDGLDGARGIADWSLSNLGIHTNGLERMLGHALMTLNDLYEATGEERYLRGSSHLVDQALKWEHPVRGGFLAPIHESPAYVSGAPFNNGVLSAGLIKFNEWAKLPELDELLVRFAKWVLTDGWYAPGGLANKGGSPRNGGSPQHIGVQGRLMARAYALTQDPLFLAVPAKLARIGFAPTAKPIPGTRSTGLIYNHLPWLLGSLHANGNPEPEPQLEIIAPPAAALTVVPGGRIVVSVTVKNTGPQPVEDLRVSLNTRRDLTVETLRTVPARLGPGESTAFQYAITAPAQVNLSCNYNRVAWTHWSAVYRRDTRAHYAHQPLKIVLADPAPEPSGEY